METFLCAASALQMVAPSEFNRLPLVADVREQG